MLCGITRASLGVSKYSFNPRLRLVRSCEYRAAGANDELRLIQEAYKKWGGLALLHQKKQKRFGFSTTLLGPVAVLLLTVQILAFPHASPVALTLIAAELASLMIVLSVGFINIGSPDEWMRY